MNTEQAYLDGFIKAANASELIARLASKLKGGAGVLGHAVSDQGLVDASKLLANRPILSGLGGLGLGLGAKEVGSNLGRLSGPSQSIHLTDELKPGGPLNPATVPSVNTQSILHSIFNHVRNNKLGYGAAAGALGLGGAAYLYGSHHQPSREQNGLENEPGSEENFE